MALNSIFRKNYLPSFMKISQVQIQQIANGHEMTVTEYNLYKIGKREIVGFGINGNPAYFDQPEFPMPAIRYKEPTPDIVALREKEKGDWNKLSLEEKKTLYRASFRQTYSEMEAPTGEWKFSLSVVLIISSLAMWVIIWLKTFVLNPLPKTFSDEHRQAMMQRMIDLKYTAIDGPCEKYDYEQGKWKE